MPYVASALTWAAQIELESLIGSEPQQPQTRREILTHNGSEPHRAHPLQVSNTLPFFPLTFHWSQMGYQDRCRVRRDP